MKSSLKQFNRLTDKKYINNSLNNHYLKSSYLIDKNLQKKPPLTKIQSSSLLKKKNNSDLPLLQQRYLILEQNYKNMLIQARNKSQIFRIQKEAVEKLRKIVEKDQNQIYQLKRMLQIKKKKNQIAQTTQTQVQASLFRRMTSDQKNRVISSTGQSQITSETAEQRYSDIKKCCEKKKNRIFQKIQLQNRKVTQQKPLSLLSKRYRFVPTLTLN